MRLTPTEWAFLELLARNVGRLVPREQILREVWGPAYVHETTTCGCTPPSCAASSRTTRPGRGT